MFSVKEFTDEEKYKSDFLLLPKLLYDKQTYTQNETEERSILDEAHVLSKYCKQRKILVYNDSGEFCGRCIVTFYPDTDSAFIGYFECIENSDCAAMIFDYAHKCAKEEGYRKIIGPLDTSFWIKYRLKIDNFDRRPYIGEPYNLPYYKQMFEDNGYSVLEKWVSNIFTKMPFFNRQKTMYKKRLERAEKANYKIVSPKRDEFDATIDIIYNLISETFKDFITFREITLEDFREIFKNYRYILDYHFVKIAYCGDEPVAFSIALPDYENLLYGDLTAVKKLRILLKRIRCKNYVSLYMGVKKEHRGLGRALSQKLIESLRVRGATCIGALITEGKVTENFGKEYTMGKIRYILFEKELQ
jgi:GNAT superfamily N-acetyltransferase